MEIKFRAKRVDFEKLHPVQHWVYGYYFIAPLTAENCNDVPVKDGHFFLSDGKIRHCIATEHGVVYEVLPETVGQYIGLDDKNKVEIYEGDMLEYFMQGYKQTGYYLIENLWDLRIEMDNSDNYLRIDDNLKIIGNVFDNPESKK